MVFHQYADFYDTFYRRKNYQKECDFLEQLFALHAPRSPKTILDLGCGTGGHMLPLARRGYHLTGVDASSRMLSLARAKFAKNNLRAKFMKSKIQSLRLGEKFDAVVCLFSVIDYVTRDGDLLKSFRSIAGRMKKLSLFIFDFWQAEAVEKYFSPKKGRAFKTKDGVVERRSLTTIDRENRLCEVDYQIRIESNGRPKEFFQEKHCLRYFSVDEMEHFLQKAGMNVLGVYPFLNILGTIRSNTWDVTVVARKV